MEKDAYITTWHIVYIVIVIPTVFGNGLILWCVIKFERLRRNMHILVANLAVSDLILGAVLIPLDLLADIFQLKSNKYVCLTTLSIFVLSLGSSCYNLLLISVERFIVIVYPFSKTSLLSKPKFIFMIAIGWILCTTNSTIPFYCSGIFNSSHQCLNTNVWPRAYQGYLDWILIFGLVVNFVCYMIVMLIAVRKARKKTLASTIFQVHSKVNRDFHHLFTMTIILGMFLICWVPYSILGIIVTFKDTTYFQFVKRCALIPGFLNSSMNWIIYGYRNKEYRKAFKQTFRKTPVQSTGHHADSLTVH